MAMQKIIYRVSDNIVQYIDNFTSEHAAASGGVNNNPREYIVGDIEASDFASFIASVDYYTTPASGPYYQDFWESNHTYTAVPSSKTIVQGDAQSISTDYYGIFRFNRNSETPACSSENYGYVSNIIPYTDVSVSSTVCGYYGVDGPYTKAYYGEASGEAYAEFFDTNHPVSKLINNSHLYNIWASGGCTLFLDSADSISTGSYSGVVPTVRSMPAISILDAAPDTSTAFGIQVTNISYSAPSATEMLVALVHKDSADFAWNNGDGSQLVSGSTMFGFRAYRPTCTDVWSGDAVTASDVNSFTLTAQCVIDGDWIARGIAGWGNKATVDREFYVYPPTNYNYLLYAYKTNASPPPSGNNVGYVAGIERTASANATTSPNFFGTTVVETQISGGTAYFNKADDWYVDGTTAQGLSLNASGYSQWAAYPTSGIYVTQSEDTVGAYPVCAYDNLPTGADRAQPTVEITEVGGGAITPPLKNNTWYQLAFSGVSENSCTELFFRFCAGPASSNVIDKYTRTTGVSTKGVVISRAGTGSSIGWPTSGATASTSGKFAFKCNFGAGNTWLQASVLPGWGVKAATATVNSSGYYPIENSTRIAWAVPRFLTSSETGYPANEAQGFVCRGFYEPYPTQQASAVQGYPSLASAGSAGCGDSASAYYTLAAFGAPPSAGGKGIVDCVYNASSTYLTPGSGYVYNYSTSNIAATAQVANKATWYFSVVNSAGMPLNQNEYITGYDPKYTIGSEPAYIIGWSTSDNSLIANTTARYIVGHLASSNASAAVDVTAITTADAFCVSAGRTNGATNWPMQVAGIFPTACLSAFSVQLPSTSTGRTKGFYKIKLLDSNATMYGSGKMWTQTGCYKSTTGGTETRWAFTSTKDDAYSRQYQEMPAAAFIPSADSDKIYYFGSKDLPGTNHNCINAGSTFTFSRWSPSNLPSIIKHADICQLDQVAYAVGVSGTNGFRMYRSADGGASWASAGLGYKTTNGPPAFVSCDPNGEENVYVGTSGALWASTDSGATFTALGSLTGASAAINCCAVNPTSSADILVGTYAHILKSADSGGTFSQVELSANESVAAIAFATVDPTIVYALAAGSASNKSTMWKSTDSGATFTKLTNFPSIGVGWTSREVGSNNPVGMYYDRPTIAIDSADASTLYACLPSLGIWKSSNGGTSFTAITQTQVSKPCLMTMDPNNSSILYVFNQDHNSGFTDGSYGTETWDAIIRIT